MVACTSAQPTAPPAAPPATLGPTAEPQPTATLQATGNPQAFGRLAGVWASDVLHRSDFDAALTRDGLDAGDLPEWLGDWSKTTYRLVKFEIVDGRWLDSEYSDGVITSGFDAPVAFDGDSAVVLTDEEANCSTSMDVTRSDDELTFNVMADDCPNDLAAQTALYESTPFHLVQAADWTPPSPDPTPVASPFPATPPSTSHERLVAQPLGEVNGAQLGYYEYLPLNYTEAGPSSPLLLFLHGSGESGAGDKFSLAKLTGAAIPNLISANKWPDDRPFVVLAPQHEQVPPSFCFGAEEIHDFLSFALDNYNVDPSRVYVTGLSCGAIGLWNYLGEHTDEVVAAAVPIAGYGLGAVGEAGCDLGKVPIWAFHGAQDPDVAIEGDVYPLTFLNSCSDPAPVDARLTVYKLGFHNVWDETYGLGAGYDIYSWLLSHSK
jgi:predicted esterase